MPGPKATAQANKKCPGRLRELFSQLSRPDDRNGSNSAAEGDTRVEASVADDVVGIAARKFNQEKRARELARTRATAASVQAAKVRSQMRSARILEKERQRMEEAGHICELHLTQLSGQVFDIGEQSQLRVGVNGHLQRPQTTVAERQLIVALRGTMTQREVADKVGVSQSTVSRLHNRKPGAGHARRGRPRVLQDEHIEAAARYLSLNKTSGMRQATHFLDETFTIKVSASTLSKHLRRDRGGSSTMRACINLTRS